MSQLIIVVLTVHCMSIRSIKSKESFRICLIRERGNNTSVVIGFCYNWEIETMGN